MRTAAEIAEEAILQIDNPDAGDDADKKGAADDTGANKDGDKGSREDDKGAGASDDDSGAGDDDGSKGTDDKDKSDEEGEFTADDALEEEDKTPSTPDANKPTDNAGIQLSPAEQKHIVDNIGEPIIVRGIQGEGDNAKEVELKVYSPNDIPKNFKFGSDADMLAAQNGFYNLEQRAQRILGEFRENQTRAQAADFEKRENEGIKADLAEMQKAGEFPKFKVKPGDKGFEDDPAAKLMADVLVFQAERNKQYLKEYQQGRPYKYIGFREAAELHNARQASNKRTTAQDKEDSERREVTKKVGTGRSLTTDKIQKAAVPRGMTVDQILARHENDFED